MKTKNEIILTKFADLLVVYDNKVIMYHNWLGTIITAEINTREENIWE